jgi:BioD-like phosphotransacetylase family protein
MKTKLTEEFVWLLQLHSGPNKEAAAALLHHPKATPALVEALRKVKVAKVNELPAAYAEASLTLARRIASLGLRICAERILASYVRRKLGVPATPTNAERLLRDEKAQEALAKVVDLVDVVLGCVGAMANMPSLNQPQRISQLNQIYEVLRMTKSIVERVIPRLREGLAYATSGGNR